MPLPVCFPPPTTPHFPFPALPPPVSPPTGFLQSPDFPSPVLPPAGFPPPPDFPVFPRRRQPSARQPLPPAPSPAPTKNRKPPHGLPPKYQISVFPQTRVFPARLRQCRTAASLPSTRQNRTMFPPPRQTSAFPVQSRHRQLPLPPPELQVLPRTSAPVWIFRRLLKLRICSAPYPDRQC